ncbi:MAG: VCBS repeat-containing protein [Verrucomicrobia subdivision 3 bacterium]|nr:VCBS repeat-containing protein [Limisphaerales bacterium]
MNAISLAKVLSLICLFMGAGMSSAALWKQHLIDNTSRGPDGVRLMDVNRDGRPDIATGWEEGGVVRAYFHPGKAKTKQPWPRLEVGRVSSPEDALFADLDGDGDADVVSCCEGRTRSVYFHWSPANDPQREVLPWRTEIVPATRNKQSWMFALPLQINGGGIDLVLGSKGAGASIGWLRSPKNPRDMKAWQFHRWYDAGWIMSLINYDIDGDGDLDVLASDRKGKTSGILWLENPGLKPMRADPIRRWAAHRIGVDGKEAMFISISKDKTIYAAARPNQIYVLRPGRDVRRPWQSEKIIYPSEKYGTSKAARAADLDGDGLPEIVVTCELAHGKKSGVFYLKLKEEQWIDHDIGGPKGVKYDRIEMLDLDGDGDLDLLTCEEREINAVVWYENPHR